MAEQFQFAPQISEGIRRARERAQAFNARLDAKQKVERLESSNASLFEENAHLRSENKQLRNAWSKPIADNAVKVAGSELGRLFAAKFIEKASAGFDKDTELHFGMVAEQMVRSKEIVFTPPKVQEAFFQVVDRMQTDTVVPRFWERGMVIADKVMIEVFTYWEPTEFHYRMAV